MKRRIRYYGNAYDLDIPLGKKLTIINNTAYVPSGHSVKKIPIPLPVREHLEVKGVYPIIEITRRKENLFFKSPKNKLMSGETVISRDSVSGNKTTIPESLLDTIGTNSLLYVIDPEVLERVIIFGFDITKKQGNGIESKLKRTLE